MLRGLELSRDQISNLQDLAGPIHLGSFKKPPFMPTTELCISRESWDVGI